MGHNRKFNENGFRRNWWEPGYWPHWARTGFAYTYPVSAPLYAILVVMVVLGGTLGLAVICLLATPVEIFLDRRRDSFMEKDIRP